MNLRELVAELECKGKPEASERPVMVSVDGVEYSVTGIRIIGAAAWIIAE